LQLLQFSIACNDINIKKKESQMIRRIHKFNFRILLFVGIVLTTSAHSAEQRLIYPRTDVLPQFRLNLDNARNLSTVHEQSEERLALSDDDFDNAAAVRNEKFENTFCQTQRFFKVLLYSVICPLVIYEKFTSISWRSSDHYQFNLPAHWSPSISIAHRRLLI
jgi:hypothetical protein